MNSNGLLKWLLLLLVALAVVVAINLRSTNTTPAAKSERGATLTPEEMKALGIEGDTPRDTVATLVGQVKQLRQELKTSASDSLAQKNENDRLRQRESTIEQRMEGLLASERKRTENTRSNEREQTQGLLKDLQQQLQALSQKDVAEELPIGLGLQAGDEPPPGKNGLRWVEPDDARQPDLQRGKEKTPTFPTRFGPAQQPLKQLAESVSERSAKVVTPPTPVYSVPANATLMGSVAMTALIGRVPIDGTVNDPYPFKILIGPDNLTANGIDLPEVAGAVVSGTASGDWTLSCVRGQVRSITFVFQDGTIRTVPDGKSNTQDGLGWISDPYGIPCVSGERRSNALQYLGSQALITAAGAGAASLIKNNGSATYVTPGNGSLGTVGITGNEAMGRILANGVQEMSQWVNKLYGQAFAAVYVEPGAKVAVHIQQALAIDYDAEGRKVDHTVGGRHVIPELD
ncbi:MULTISPECIES: TIGR03752 family integrating conjugative element protein [unclassified Pseudomonas]|uniref:TIGR03752 family integrating conjugative element protein n=1 Tax=unclassified Pseudomonas TaxID=196821 RepID=UPI000C86D398|nr:MULTISPECIES: TIGR03752 family integrating conjugative element protein [unclassified Pseudomonas]PMV22632.1 TIGR03752 family integrating conjugative element protein [Pseudomonas sp. FW305-3-2-15-C-TSA2]PMV29295.1 TIGR03752 family integrating conjugative element protein [Pseudomonas sp. DP16D-L5]PMV39198.1 TIGR03752 family integrating conjugative element protein [Pseudomonas sp. FW305-3-2-15-A-LB2]PMV45508.1 TIGR03752 family integrating conjugative element protein [Pseudomonas sp. FW305-3-2-1